MNMPAECLVNIEMAKQNCYPKTKYEAIKRRKEKCLELMQLGNSSVKPHEAWNFFKLSFSPNDKFPFIVDCLQMKTDKKYGRNIVTNRSLKVGDIIAIEEPFCAIIQEKFVHQRCANCFASNFLNLFPCDSCIKGFINFLFFYCLTELIGDFF